MSKYKLINDTLVWCVDDDITFPLPANESEGFKYLAWLEAGNTPEPADPIENPRIAEIKQQLNDLDFKKIRPLAAGDSAYLAKLQEQTVALQDELRSLM